MKKNRERKLTIHRESLMNLDDKSVNRVQGATAYNCTWDPCYPFSYPKSACPGDTCI